MDILFFRLAQISSKQLYAVSIQPVFGGVLFTILQNKLSIYFLCIPN